MARHAPVRRRCCEAARGADLEVKVREWGQERPLDRHWPDCDGLRGQHHPLLLLRRGSCALTLVVVADKKMLTPLVPSSTSTSCSVVPEVMTEPCSCRPR
jgi:hypothetical protein